MEERTRHMMMTYETLCHTEERGEGEGGRSEIPGEQDVDGHATHKRK